MPRLPRLKIEDAAATYHLSARTDARRGEYPLSDPVMAEKLVDLIEFYTTAYYCHVEAYIVMGNHYHLIVHFEEPRPVGRKELRERARWLYPGREGEKTVGTWSRGDWNRFRKRLFDVSELMRNVQGSYATWYNRVVDRRGGFWADRFSSTLLEGAGPKLDCMLYVELNAVRAGLVERPEDYRFSSLHAREVGDAEWLTALTDTLPEDDEKQALRHYRSLIYHRGAVPTKPNHKALSMELLALEEARGFAIAGAFSRRLRHFSEGAVIGARTAVLELIARYRQIKSYPCRREPVSRLEGLHWAIKDQYRQRSPT